MYMNEMLELTKIYAACPECGNDKVNGEPSQGILALEDEIFMRSCKCGWAIKVDRRIKHIGTTTTKNKSNKLIGGVFEVSIHNQGHKFLPLLELKERAGVKRINQYKKLEEWLNSAEGRKWALEVPAESVL